MEGQSEAIKKTVYDSKVKIVFILGKHGLGKTYLLNSIFNHELRSKKRRIFIKRIDLSGLTTKKDIVLRLLGPFGKFIGLLGILSLILLFFFGLKCLFSYLNITEGDLFSTITTTVVGIYLFYVNDDKASVLYRFNSLFLEKIKDYFLNLIYGAQKVIWVDDLERCGLSHQEEWSIIENLAYSPYRYIVTIGFNEISQEQMYSNRISKFSELLSELDKKAKIRRFYLNKNAEINTSIMTNYFTENFRGFFPFVTGQVLDFLSDFSAREINSLCIKVDNSLVAHLGARIQSLSETDYKKYVFIFTIRELFLWYYERLNHKEESPLDCFTFCLTPVGNQLQMAYASANNHDAFSYKLFSSGFNIKLNDFLSKTINVSVHQRNTIAYSTVWNAALKHTNSQNTICPELTLNDLVSSGFPNKQADVIFRMIR